MEHKVNVTVAVDMDDVLNDLSDDEVKDMIKAMDKRQEDWEFTEEMTRWFMAQMRNLYDSKDEWKKFLKSFKDEKAVEVFTKEQLFICEYFEGCKLGLCQHITPHAEINIRGDNKCSIPAYCVERKCNTVCIPVKSFLTVVNPSGIMVV